MSPSPHDRALVRENWAASRIIQALRVAATAGFCAFTFALGLAKPELFTLQATISAVLVVYLAWHVAMLVLVRRRPPPAWHAVGAGFLDAVVITVAFCVPWFLRGQLPPRGPPNAMEPAAYFGMVILANAMRFTNRPAAAASLGSLAGFALLAELRGYPWHQVGYALLAIAIFSALALIGSGALRRMLMRGVDEAVSRERLRRYLPEQVAEAVAEAGEEPRPGGEEREVSVLFVDIRRSTALAQGMSAPGFVELLNEFYARIVREVFHEGGTLDKFIGDGVLVFFGAPGTQPDHAERAVRCALRIQLALEGWNLARRGRGEAPVEAGCGVHSGRAIVGNVGTAERLEYTVIGDTVNLASRVEDLTKVVGAPVLVTADTCARLPGGRFSLVPRGEHAVRGRSGEVEVFQPVDSATGPVRRVAAVE